MRLTVRADGRPADGAGAPAYLTRKKMTLVDFNQMMTLIGQRLDHDQKLQDRDAAGLLWLDAQGATKTQAEVDAALAGTVGLPRGEGPVFTPKFRPRTAAETWDVHAERFLNSLAKIAEREFRDQKEREIQAPPTLAVDEDP